MNIFNKAFQLSHFVHTFLPPLQNVFYVSEVCVGWQPLFLSFKKITQFPYEDFRTIHLRMKAWHGSLLCGSQIHANARGSIK